MPESTVRASSRSAAPPSTRGRRGATPRATPFAHGATRRRGQVGRARTGRRTRARAAATARTGVSAADPKNAKRPCNVWVYCVQAGSSDALPAVLAQECRRPMGGQEELDRGHLGAWTSGTAEGAPESHPSGAGRRPRWSSARDVVLSLGPVIVSAVSGGRLRAAGNAATAGAAAGGGRRAAERRAAQFSRERRPPRHPARGDGRRGAPQRRRRRRGPEERGGQGWGRSGIARGIRDRSARLRTRSYSTLLHPRCARRPPLLNKEDAKGATNRPRALLFEGLPGTGKTSAAKAIAAHASVALIYVPLEAVASKYYGDPSGCCRRFFNCATGWKARWCSWTRWTRWRRPGAVRCTRRCGGSSPSCSVG